ncbi:Cystathionine beta-lyase PatB [anaerobic digester metagenome]|jgi:cystathionine beta-lyase
MQYNFDRSVDRRSSLSVKWNKEAIKSLCGNPDAEPFWVADMDFPVAAEVAQKARNLSEHAIFGYPYANNQRQVFCAWAKARHQMDIQPAQVVISQGVLTSIAVLVELLTDEGDGIIIPLPAYQPFIRIVNNLHRNVLGWPLLYNRDSHTFSLDWDAYEQLCKQAKILIFCSPQNPTGLVFSEQELARLCGIAKQNNVVIICDEIHADLSYGKHITLLEPARQVGCEAVVCMAPSKTFNIAGEHYSVTLFNNPDMKQRYLTRLEQLFIAEPSLVATTLALASYQSGAKWLDELLVYLQKNADIIENTLQKEVPSLVFIKPRASFIGLLDCSAILDLVERDAQAHPQLYDSSTSAQGGLLSRFFGQRANLAFNDGTWFGGTAYRQFVRLNFGTQHSNIERALNLIKEAVAFLEATYR